MDLLLTGEKYESGAAAPLAALRDSGMLWALNRYVLHPRGLALALHYDERSPRHPDPVGWSLIAAAGGDGGEVEERECWRFDDSEDDRMRDFETTVAFAQAHGTLPADHARWDASSPASLRHFAATGLLLRKEDR